MEEVETGGGADGGSGGVGGGGEWGGAGPKKLSTTHIICIDTNLIISERRAKTHVLW